MQKLEFPTTRFCCNCQSHKPKDTGKLVPLPHNPLRGIWLCKQCLGREK